MGTMATEPAGKRLEETQYLCTLIKKLPSSCLAESAHHSAWMVPGESATRKPDYDASMCGADCSTHSLVSQYDHSTAEVPA